MVERLLNKTYCCGRSQSSEVAAEANDVADDGTLIKRPLNAEQSAERLKDLTRRKEALIASGNYVSVTDRTGSQAVYDPRMWDMQAGYFPVPKAARVIDPSQRETEATLAARGFSELYSNSLDFAIYRAEQGNVLPMGFPTNPTAQSLYDYNKDAQFWLYERSKQTASIGAFEGTMLRLTGGAWGVGQSIYGGFKGAASLAYDFAGTALYETGAERWLGIEDAHRESAERLGQTVGHVVDFVSNDGRAAKIYNSFANRFNAAQQLDSRGDAAGIFWGAAGNSSAVFDIGASIVTAGEGAAFTWSKVGGATRSLAGAAFEGPAFGPRAQWGAIGDLSGGPFTATRLRNTPGVATASGPLSPVSGRWLDASVPNPIPVQVADALVGREFSTFSDLQSAVWKTIGNSSELSAGFTRSNINLMRDGLAPYAPTEFLNSSNAFGQSFNLHHDVWISRGGAVYDLSNLYIVSPKVHYGFHY